MITVGNCRSRQIGSTLIEVLVSIMVFIIASSALIISVTHLFENNTLTKAMIDTNSLSTSFDALIKGNQNLLSALNGLNMYRGAGTSPPELNQWWSRAQATNPFLKSVNIVTEPAACQPRQPCLVTLTMRLNPAFRPELVRIYALQENF